MPYTPSADATNTVALAAANMANDGYTALQTALAAGLTAPAAYVDALLSSMGFQAAYDESPASTTTTSTTFVNSTFTGYTFNAPIAKAYRVTVNCGGYSGVGTGAFVYFALKNATRGVLYDAQTAKVYCTNLWTPLNIVFDVAVTMNQGSNLLELWWKVDSGITGYMNGDTPIQLVIQG